jgi:hypothetical protein
MIIYILPLYCGKCKQELQHLVFLKGYYSRLIVEMLLSVVLAREQKTLRQSTCEAGTAPS